MGQLRIVAYGESNVGQVREHNEDSFISDPLSGLFLVADGVGGGNAGEIASSMLADYVVEQVSDLTSSLEGQPPAEHGKEYLTQLPKMIERASEMIYRQAQEESAQRGMATTAVLLKIVGSEAVICHVGDSRLYLVRGENFYQITQDHSLAREMVERGLLTEEEIPRFRYKNVILRSVGLQPTVQVDSMRLDILPGDVLVLCSDGLTDPVSRDEIHQIVAKEPPREAVQKLIAAANAGGGPDNVTVIMVQVLGTPPPSQVMVTEQRAAMLSNVFLFEDLSFPELLKVMQYVHEVRMRRGEHVLRAGQEGDHFFLLISGSVEVLQEGVLLNRIGPGGHFGELSLISVGVRSADVRTLEDSELLAIPRLEFYELLHNDHTLATKLLWRFLQNLGVRVRDLSGQVTRLMRERDMGRSRTVGDTK